MDTVSYHQIDDVSLNAEVPRLKEEVERLKWDIEAYRGALGYSVPGNHTGKLTNGETPQCGICNSEHRKNIDKEVERLRGELAEANHWRDRHCADAKAYGEQSQKNWEEVGRLKVERDRDVALLNHKLNAMQSALEKAKVRLEEILQVCEFIDNEDQHQTKLTKATLATIKEVLGE